MTTLIPKYDQGATGAVNRAINFKFAEIVSVLDFGADSTGTTDCSSAVQAAFNTGKSIYFPSGTYLINNAVVPLNNQKIFGAGMGQTIINSVAQSAITNIFTITANNVSVTDLTINVNVNGKTQIRAFTFGTGTVTTVVGFYMNNVTINGTTSVTGHAGFFINNCNLSNVYISNSQFNLLLEAFYKANGDTSIQLNHNWSSCYFHSCTDCININSNVSAWSDISITDCFFLNITQFSVAFAGTTCGRASVSSCHFVNTGVEGIHIEAGANEISIVGNQFAGCSNASVNGAIHIITGSHDISISDNSIDGTVSGGSSIITVQAGGGTSPYNVALTNNTFNCNALNTYGVFFSSVNGIAITNNVFNNQNTASKITAFITAASSNITGSSNYFYNPNYLVSVDDLSGGEISGSNIYGNTSTFNFLTGNSAANTSIAFRDFSIVQAFTCNATSSVNNPLFGIGRLINGTVGLRYIQNGTTSAFITTGNLYYDNTTLTTANVKTYAGASGSTFTAFTQSGGSVCATGYKATSETGVVHVTFSGIIFP